MNQQNTAKLFADFPELYRGRDLPKAQNLMSFGFEFGDGWFDIVYKLSQNIDRIAKDAGMSGDDYPYAAQVKEKFGGLRFYMEPMSNKIFEKVNELTNKAEADSLKTCEQCGKPAQESNDSGGGWIFTLCEKCAENKRLKK